MLVLWLSCSIQVQGLNDFDSRLMFAVFGGNRVLSLHKGQPGFRLALAFFSAAGSFHIAIAVIEGAPANVF
jgi:hypothetical protein